MMQMVAPLGPAYQAGTLSGNPLAAAAGIACLTELEKPGIYEKLEHLGAETEEALRSAANSAGVPVMINRVGSMFTTFFTEHQVTTWSEAAASDTSSYAQYFHGLLARGVYCAPSQFEAAFVSLAHSTADLEFSAAQARFSLQEF